MRTNTLSHPDSATVLQEIDTENSGSIYLYTAPAARSEMAHFESIRRSPRVRENQVLSNLIDQHIERTSAQIQFFLRNGQEKMIAIKRPPSPCPPPVACKGEIEYINFYTVNPHDRIDLRFNDETLETQTISYDALTRIQTVQIPGKIKYVNGDQLNIHIDVSYDEYGGEINNQPVEWVMRF